MITLTWVMPQTLMVLLLLLLKHEDPRPHQVDSGPDAHRHHRREVRKGLPDLARRVDRISRKAFSAAFVAIILFAFAL